MISRLLIPAILAACVGSTTLGQSTLDRAIVGATAPAGGSVMKPTLKIPARCAATTTRPTDS